MRDRKVRHLVAKPNADGSRRFYWQPSAELRAGGWRVQPLGHDEAAAIAKAEQINAEVDASRRKPVATPRPPARPRVAPRPTGRPAASGWSGVYVVWRMGAEGVKVGIAADMAGRLIQLQTGSPEKLRLALYWRCPHQAAVIIERRVVDHFLGQIIRGEWIKAPVEVVLDSVLDLVAEYRSHVRVVPGSHVQATVADTFAENAG
jgi:hypothetical protein